MPELPGPPEDASDEYRRAWLEGAATVAQLQADQWAIIAGRYREAADEIGDGDAGDETTLDSPADGEGGGDGPKTCPECEHDPELVEGLGGTAVCPHCGTSPSD